MSEQIPNDTIAFDLPKNQSSVIKVIGVGGGGSNAVNHMFGMGIRGVDFAVCNTDAQALSNSPVPNKIQLGVTLTEGLGAGANPEVGHQSAEESIEEIKVLLEKSTKMVFITAGMGGGTGTGAAPVIAKTAKALGVLTVGIVTMPFQFEGNNRKQQAEKGIEALRNSVDSLIVINNNKLREVYGNLGFKAGFAKADEVLATAARGIAEVITHHYTTNIDLRDAKTVLADSGTAIMGSSTASGEIRAKDAISRALDSPLLNDNHIKGAKNVLLLIVSGSEEITIDEIGEINDHIQTEAGGSANIIMGIGEDESLGGDISVTIVATGFNADQQVQVSGSQPQKVVHTLEDEQAVSTSIYNKPLQAEKEEDGMDDVIAYELAKAKEREQKEASIQPDLFAIQTPEAAVTEEIIEEEETIINNIQDPAEETLEEEKEIFQLEEEEVDIPILQEETIEEEIVSALPVPPVEPTVTFALNDEVELNTEAPLEEQTPVEQEAAPQAEVDVPAPAESVFSIDEAPAPVTEVEKVEEAAPVSEPLNDTGEKVVYSLDDYLSLEEKLNASQPVEETTETVESTTASVSPTPNEENNIEDDALQFEVKQVETETKPKASPESNSGNASPMDLTIEQSMRLRADERRSKLKAFNHRFKNHPYNAVDETENEPAYKRQGINIDNEQYSKEGRISRFTIGNDEEGTNMKSNNSFLHDNVD